MKLSAALFIAHLSLLAYSSELYAGSFSDHVVGVSSRPSFLDVSGLDLNPMRREVINLVRTTVSFPYDAF